MMTQVWTLLNCFWKLKFPIPASGDSPFVNPNYLTSQNPQHRRGGGECRRGDFTRKTMTTKKLTSKERETKREILKSCDIIEFWSLQLFGHNNLDNLTNKMNIPSPVRIDKAQRWMSNSAKWSNFAALVLCCTLGLYSLQYWYIFNKTNIYTEGTFLKLCYTDVT